MNLPRALRSGIRIEGEEVADLDYTGMFPRLAFLRLGIMEPPGGDLYAVSGLEGHRDGVKRMMNAFIFASSDKVRIPKDIKALLPKGATAGSVREAILKRYPKLEEAFGSGLGLSLMFDESRILVAVLLRLAERGIAALPMHDGLMVARSKVDVVRGIMEDVAEREVGFRLPVVLKDGAIVDSNPSLSSP